MSVFWLIAFFGVVMITKWLGSWVKSIILVKGWERKKQVTRERILPLHLFIIRWCVFYGLGSHGIHHHEKSPFWESIFETFSKQIQVPSALVDSKKNTHRDSLGPASKVRFSQHPPISISLQVPIDGYRWYILFIHVAVDAFIDVRCRSCMPYISIHEHIYIYTGFFGRSESKHSKMCLFWIPGTKQTGKQPQIMGTCWWRKWISVTKGIYNLGKTKSGRGGGFPKASLSDCRVSWGHHHFVGKEETNPSWNLRISYRKRGLFPSIQEPQESIGADIKEM